MATHELKTWREPFQAALRGAKTHEVRKRDRNFSVGDILHLREYDPDTQEYSGDHFYMKITYITHGGSFGLPADICVMSVKQTRLP